MVINLFVASSLQELEQIDVSGVVGSGEEVVDIFFFMEASKVI